MSYTLKHKGATRCHIEEDLCLNGSLKNLKHLKKLGFTQGSLGKKVLQIITKVRFFKDPLTECFFVEPNMVLLCIGVKNLLCTF